MNPRILTHYTYPHNYHSQSVSYQHKKPNESSMNFNKKYYQHKEAHPAPQSEPLKNWGRTVPQKI